MLSVEEIVVPFAWGPETMLWVKQGWFILENLTHLCKLCSGYVTLG